MEIGLVLAILKEGLILSNTIAGRKYLDRVIDLEKDFFDELAKDDENRNDFILDSIMLELETIARNFTKYPVKK